MNTSFTSKIARTVVAVLLSVLILSGCQKDKPVEQPSQPSTGTFTGQDLPLTVTELEGTPFYSQSEELSSVAELKGAVYMLIAPQDPTTALIVVEDEVAPAEVAKRESKPVKLSGVSESVDSEALQKFVKEQVGLDVKLDGEGKVVVLRVEQAVYPSSTPESSLESE